MPSSKQIKTNNFSHWLPLPILAFGLALVILDGTIVGVALPKIILDLHLDLAASQWINAIYSMVFAALLIGFGNLGDQLGRKTVFLIGVLIFVLSSITAGLASSAGPLLLARFSQGIGGAMVLPASLSIVNAIYQEKDRTIAFGIWGAVMAGSAAIGPLLGGWLTTYYTWRWVFWVNIPIGLIVFVIGLVFLPQTFGRKQTTFDWLGLVLSIFGMAALVFSIIEGSTLGWWRPKAALHIGSWQWGSDFPLSPVPILFGLGIILLLFFLGVEFYRLNHNRCVLMDLSLFKISSFSWGNITALTVSIAEFALVFIFPLYLVNVVQLSILQAGYVLAAMAAGAFISGASARILSELWGTTRVVVLGLGLELAGFLSTTLIMKTGQSPIVIALPLILYGFGLGLAAAQLTSTVLSDIPVEVSGQGSAIQSTLRQIGSALGTALSGTVLAFATHHFVIQQLLKITQIKPEQANKLADLTTDSVGANLLVWKSKESVAFLGDASSAIIAASREGFRLGTVWAMSVGITFLTIGLICAIILAWKGNRTKTMDV